MEGLTVDMSAATGALKGSFSIQKNAVNGIMQGAQQATASIPKEGDDTARTMALQSQGIGNKLDITA